MKTAMMAHLRSSESIERKARVAGFTLQNIHILRRAIPVSPKEYCMRACISHEDCLKRHNGSKLISGQVSIHAEDDRSKVFLACVVAR